MRYKCTSYELDDDEASYVLDLTLEEFERQFPKSFDKFRHEFLHVDHHPWQHLLTDKQARRLQFLSAAKKYGVGLPPL